MEYNKRLWDIVRKSTSVLFYIENLTRGCLINFLSTAKMLYSHAI